ncbi:Rad52/Rad22 family DNA repair protein [Caloranaerobacter sp. DY30410]|uniref:Rad52/Rad22 family DNA repair protein n=1 Tax=Caloranaerobacter sp. DY30410 TaxID=3238305 RepID=UPI003D01FE96
MAETTLFERLNAPFKYDDYEYDSYGKKVYVKGQAVAERLNEVLGVGYWKYRPLPESIIVKDTGKKDKNGNKIFAVKVLVEFSFYNKELKEWIVFVDAGSQDLNAQMWEGDATKSAITDGMKKCASRIGVASDVYKGLIKAVNGKVVLPEHYRKYYEEKGWPWPNTTQTQSTRNQTISKIYELAKKIGYDKKSIDEKVKEEYGVSEVKFLKNDKLDHLLNRLEKAVKNLA